MRQIPEILAKCQHTRLGARSPLGLVDANILRQIMSHSPPKKTSR